MSKHTQQSKLGATLRLQYNQNLSASFCVEGSGSANKHDHPLSPPEKKKKTEKRKRKKQNKKTLCFSSSLFLDGEVHYITVLSVSFKKKYVEYSLVGITVWEQTKNIQDPQTALRNAGIFHGYLSSEEKGEEESGFKNLQFTFKTSLSSPSSCLAGVKHLFPAKIFIEPLLYAYLLGSCSTI